MKSSAHKKTPALAGAEVWGNEINFEEEIVMSDISTVVDMRKFVEARDGKAFTTSQQVAEAFGKLHNHVIAKVRNLGCSAQFLTDNFSSVQFDHRGNAYEAFEMTKDGFMFLVMGFTGKKAAAIKEGYIAAFNEMAMLLGRSAQGIVGEVVAKALGKDGALVLSNIMRCRVAKLDSDHQRSATAKLASALHARFSVPRIELIPADQMDSACNFIAAYAIEGEYLGKEEAVGATVNWPASRWLAESMPDVRKRMTQFQGAGNMMIAPDMLFGPAELLSPTLRAITELEKQGHNLEACRLEVLAMKHHLEGAEYAFSGLRLWADRTQGNGVRFSVQEDAA